MTKILVVEDEKAISDVIRFNLLKEDYEVVTADNGISAVELFESENPDLVLLDQMIPELDGTEVLKRIRATSNTPVIFVTAKDDEIDKVLGLELGADDYVTKPFGNRELISRIKARLRNVNNAVADNPGVAISSASEVTINDLRIKPESFQVFRNNQEVELTHREFELLTYLVRHTGQVLTRETLLNEVWGFDYYGDVRTVDVTIRRLREKIEEDPSHPRTLMTKRGIGYYIKKDQS
ncbi:MAG: response regulator transcription factor [Lactobacillaceae bacterium]|jgi:two-component system response regulator VicR|nr:response regulator transcription factor [Lactobacillaceae bacterium]